MQAEIFPRLRTIPAVYELLLPLDHIVELLEREHVIPFFEKPFNLIKRGIIGDLERCTTHASERE